MHNLENIVDFKIADLGLGFAILTIDEHVRNLYGLHILRIVSLSLLISGRHRPLRAG